MVSRRNGRSWRRIVVASHDADRFIADWNADADNVRSTDGRNAVSIATYHTARYATERSAGRYGTADDNDS